MAYYSIIVPVYGIEVYIGPCIESILNQSYEDYEIILVDDGSKDKSGEICEQYAADEARIKVIHKINAGLSEARNTGLDHSSGKYVLFLDGDDLLYKNALSDLTECIEENGCPEVVFGIHHDFYGVEPLIINSRYHRYVGPEGAHGYDWMAGFAEERTLTWWCASTVYKRSFIKENGFRFLKGMIGAEDLDFYYRVLGRASTMANYDGGIASYRRARPGSIISNRSAQSIKGQLEARKACCQAVKDSDVSKGTKDSILRFITEDYVRRIYLIAGYDKGTHRVLAALVASFMADFAKPYISMLPGRQRVIAGLYRVFGYYRGSKLLNDYYKKKKSLKTNRRSI